MIRCALAEIFSPPTSTLRLRSASSSSVSTFGSITTPLPITHSLPGCRIPDGIRCSFHSSPSRTIVWPALLPPWKRTTASARSASRSVILPLPSSPHWAPTITIPGTRPVYGLAHPADADRRGAGRRPSGHALDLLAVIGPVERDQVTHAFEARDDAAAQLLDEHVAVDVRG